MNSKNKILKKKYKQKNLTQNKNHPDMYRNKVKLNYLKKDLI